MLINFLVILGEKLLLQVVYMWATDVRNLSSSGMTCILTQDIFIRHLDIVKLTMLTNDNAKII